MKTLQQAVRQLQQYTQCVERGDRLLIACSGGIDSMALLHYFDEEKERLHIEVAAVYVDHMLRGEQSKEDGEFVAQFCRARGIPFYTKAIAIADIVAETGDNVQNVCRLKRYEYFEELMAHYTKLVTAHHADDQLETMLMAMTKGSSVAALSGIRVRRPFAQGEMIRPFLFVTRAQIELYMNERGLLHREDPSNAKLVYTRNRVRHTVTPLLRQENEHVATHAAQLSLQLQQDDAFLYELAEQYVAQYVKQQANGAYHFEINMFQRMPLALQRRFILILLNYVYKDVNVLQSHALTASLLKLCSTVDGNAQLHLPQGAVARRQYGNMLIGYIEHEEVEARMLVPHEPVRVANYEIVLMQAGTTVLATDDVYYITLTAHEQLYIRSREDGDRILLKGMEQPKKVARLFIDEKIPAAKRQAIPLLVSNKRGILSVIGVRTSVHVSDVQQSHQWQIVIRTIAL